MPVRFFKPYPGYPRYSLVLSPGLATLEAKLKLCTMISSHGSRHGSHLPAQCAGTLVRKKHDPNRIVGRFQSLPMLEKKNQFSTKEFMRLILCLQVYTSV